MKNLLDEPNKRTIFVSAKWASKQIACCMPFIATNCGGGCCKGTSYWPSRANGNVCAHLGPTGCNFEATQRPITCLLYPFTLKADKLVLHGRALIGCCKTNYGLGGKSIWEQNRGNLVTLFGDEQFNRVLSDITVEKDSWLEVGEEFFEQLEFEHNLAEQNVVPIARERGNWNG